MNASDIIPFDFEGRAVRTGLSGGQWVFVASDVCGGLEISNPRHAVARLDDDERVSLLVDTLGGPQTMTAVTQSGLFALIMTSRKPVARRFRKWVTAEVLPALLRDGTYSLPSAPAPAPARDPFAANSARAGHVADHLAALDGIPALALRATHLPIWPNGRRPKWWSNLGVREFLTVAHRQMALHEAQARVEARFGRGVTSVSGIQRYWQRLDEALGPARDIPRPPKTKKEAA